MSILYLFLCIVRYNKDNQYKNIRLSKVYLAYLRINELRQPLEEKSFRGWKKFQLESKRVPVTLVIYIP